MFMFYTKLQLETKNYNYIIFNKQSNLPFFFSFNTAKARQKNDRTSMTKI